MNPHTLPTIKQYISDSCRTFQEKTIPGGCQKNGSFAERFCALKHHSRRLRRWLWCFCFICWSCSGCSRQVNCQKNPCSRYDPFYPSTGTVSVCKQELSSRHTAEGRVLNGSTRPSALSNPGESSLPLRVPWPA